MRNPAIKLSEVEDHLDGLPLAHRIEQVVALGKREQVTLWDIAENSQPLDLTYLVPEDAKPSQPFAFEGKNSLPVFKRFTKVFYRDDQGDVYGYSDTPKLVQVSVGNGYFQALMNPDASEYEILMDHTRIPRKQPQGWPEVKPNDTFPTNYVYGGIIDSMRRVSRDVLIGRAYKMGRSPLPTWFILCRKLNQSPSTNINPGPEFYQKGDR